MENVVDDLVKSLRAAGEPTRLRALFLLSRGELSVGELANLLGQSQPGLSRHMKFLTDAGLVERMPEGAWVFYRLAPSGQSLAKVKAILSLIDPGAAEFRRDSERLQKVRDSRAEEAKRFFDAVADRWDEIRTLHYPNEAIEAAVLKLAGDREYEKMIDIGTGTGRMLALFASRARSGEGVDLSHRMLTLARANLDRSGIRNAQVRQGDALALPFAQASADLIVVHQVLHFLDDPAGALREAARVLMPGGRIIVVDFAPHDLEFLRNEHNHRHLGRRPEDFSAWATEAGLIAGEPTKFDPPDDTAQGLSVLIWGLDKPGKRAAALSGQTLETTR